MFALLNQFDDLVQDEARNLRSNSQRNFQPLIDIEEHEKGYNVWADVPGLTAEDLEVTVENGILTLQGERHLSRASTKDAYQRTERAVGAFRRVFHLPKGVDGSGIEASVENGELKITIPKPVASLPLQVKVAGQRKVSAP
ncbi:MAG: Hsp20/alpha crystallin family protein [Polyangiaceae bacterium]|nr:Hsp20/alpha crystallin family protein [Polyangiaceae bacterium]